VNHMMIDLETLATTPRAALLQAGWAVFDPEGEDIVFSEQFNVNIDSCVAFEGEIADATIRWWLTQSPQARSSVATTGARVTDVMRDLVVSYRHYNCKALWSHGAVFDTPIVDHYIRRGLLEEPPWKFWEIRDTRTLFWLASLAGWRQEKRETAHTAETDARIQATDVQSAFRQLTSPR
jgi:hypothetical protein